MHHSTGICADLPFDLTEHVLTSAYWKPQAFLQFLSTTDDIQLIFFQLMVM